MVTNPFDVPPGLTSVPQAIRVHALERPNSPAILAPERTPLSYAGLWRQIGRTIGVLREMGIGPTDRVALVLPDGPEMAVALVATICGAVAAPINPGLGTAEFEASLSGLRAKAIIVSAGSDSPIRQIAAARDLPVIELSVAAGTKAGLFDLIGPRWKSADEYHLGDELTELEADHDRPALVLQTSGTTDLPKTFAMSQADLFERIGALISIARMTSADRVLNLMHLFHFGGTLVGSAPLVVGGSVICAPGLVLPDFFDWLDTLRPTGYTAVPAIHQAIVSEAPHHCGAIARCSLRFIRSSSAALPPALRAALEGTFGVPVFESYWSTEAGLIAYTPDPPQRLKEGSVGVAAGPYVRVMDAGRCLLPASTVGEIVVEESRVLRPENVELPPEAFTNGWFRTGDLGYIDEDRYLFITGRVKELINRGGEKVSPQEVESALLAHPDVAEAVAFAVPHPRLGEGVAAAVVPRPGASASERELRDFATARLARFKVPQQVHVLASIPRGPTGKYQRVGMAERLGLTSSDPGTANARSRVEVADPRDETETRLVAIWERLLKQAPIGVDEDFFALGGDSLLALQLLLEVEREFGTRFPDSVLYASSTIEGLATVLGRQQSAAERVSVVPLKPTGSLHPLFVCLHVGNAGATSFRHLARHIDPERPLIGVQSRGVDERGVPQRSLKAIAADYVTRIIEVQPTGTYHLCGHSAGGLIAYEVAQQLTAQGREVAFLGLFDTSCPGHAETARQEIGRHVATITSLTPRALLTYLKPRLVDTCLFARATALRALQRAMPNLRVRGRYETLWVRTGTSLAYRGYEPKPYRGKLTMFLASHRSPNYHLISQLGWEEYAMGGFDVRQVAGDHVSLLSGQDSRKLASELNACLVTR